MGLLHFVVAPMVGSEVSCSFATSVDLNESNSVISSFTDASARNTNV